MHMSWNGTFRQAAKFLFCTAVQYVWHDSKVQRGSVFNRENRFLLPLLQGFPACWDIVVFVSGELQKSRTYGLPLNLIRSPRWDLATIYHLHIHSKDLNMISIFSHHSWVFLPSSELRYPTNGKGNSSSQLPLDWDMLVSGRVSPFTWVSDSTRFLKTEIWNMSVRPAAVPHAMLSSPWVHVSQN